MDLNMVPSSTVKRIYWLTAVVLTACFSFIFNHKGVAMSQEQFFSNPTTKLLDSLTRSDQAGVSAALNSGANINEVGLKGITPLIYSVIKLSQPAVAALLKLGADPNIRQEDGYNALTAAYELSRTAPAIMETLINSGKCDLNVLMPDDEPMLYYLAASGKLDFLEMALKKGANPSLRTRSNTLLVIEAAIIEEYDAVQLLLDAGASSMATDNAGTSLLEFVKDGSSQQIDPNGSTNQSRLRLLKRLQKATLK
jgi:ankyrin repeat protein